MNLTAVSAWWNNLFVAVLQRSLGALWLIPAVLVLRLTLKRTPKWVSCLLWALVAAELVCPIQISSPLSIRNVAPKSPPVEIRYTEEIKKPELFVDFSAVPGYPDNQHTRTAKQNVHTSDFYIPPLRNLWLAGAALMLAYGTFSTLRLRKRIAAAMPAEDNVWVCDDIDAPFVLGVVCPRIYLPSALGDQETASVLAHERAHIQRGDHWWKLLGYLILAAYWFHPLVWLSYLLMGRDIELACDEKVCRGMRADQRKLYAQTLLSLSVSRSTTMARPLGFGEIGVKERVKNVAKYKKPTVLVTVTAVVLVLFASVAFGTQGQEVEKLTLALQELTISKVGDEVQLTADGGNGVYTWESDTPAVAQVDNNGVVTGKAAGAATVRCTCIDGQSAECKVTVQDSSPETNGDYPPMVMVNDTIYKDTGYKTSALSCGTMDGKITSSVDSSEIPTKNDESNFGTGYEYQYSSEGQLIVVINDECFIFKALNASSNSVNYQARSDALLTKARLVTEFEPYGVNYDGEHDHVMYDGQIVSYIERSIDTTDPSTLPEHPDNEANADPDGTVILRFLMNEAENGSVSYSRLQIFDSPTRELLEERVLNAPSNRIDSLAADE